MVSRLAPTAGGPAPGGRRPRRVGVALLLAAPVLASGRVGAQTAAPAARPSTRAVRVRIETDRATYGPGDTIAVRLTLVNAGPVPLVVSNRTPWDAVRLIVTGPHGRVIAPTRPLDRRSYRSAHGITLPPGTAFVQSYAHREWTALRSFGYGPLAPGRYTLTAVPLVEGPDVDEDDVTVRSIRVTVAVAPEGGRGVHPGPVWP